MPFGNSTVNQNNNQNVNGQSQNVNEQYQNGNGQPQNGNNKLRYSIYDIMAASLGESGSIIKGEFTKTIFLRDYETEKFDFDVELNIGNNLKGPERMLIMALVQAQVEASGFMNLYLKNRITYKEFDSRISGITNDVNYVAGMYEAMTGDSPDKYLRYVRDNINVKEH